MFSLRLSHEKKILLFLSHMISQIETMELRKIILAKLSLDHQEKNSSHKSQT